MKGIFIPIIADKVLSPEIYYGDKITGIYFQTQDDLFGRITFYNLDAIKICRGEIMPYDCEYSADEPDVWIFKIEDSKWLAERFKYENEHYGDSYQFNGNVNEMLTDFNHYLFSFHDQFIEVIARGFWFEKSLENLFGKGLTEGHPFLPLTDSNPQKIAAHNLTCQVRINKCPMDEIISNSVFCPQKLFEFALELENNASVNHTAILTNRDGELISSLRGYFGNEVVEFGGVATLEQLMPYIAKYMAEVYERRKKWVNKNPLFITL